METLHGDYLQGLKSRNVNVALSLKLMNSCTLKHKIKNYQCYSKFLSQFSMPIKIMQQISHIPIFGGKNTKINQKLCHFSNIHNKAYIKITTIIL